MNHPSRPEIPTTFAIELSPPNPDLLYNLDATAHLAGVSRRSVLLYSRAGLIQPVFQIPYEIMAFTEETIHAIRRIENLRAIHGNDMAWVKSMLHLLEEVERLRLEVRFFQMRS